MVAFACLETSAYEKDGRIRGVTTGRRILRTQPGATYDAKTRYALPASIPLDWGAFAAAMAAGGPAALDRLRAEIDALLTELGDPKVATGATAFLVERGENVASLTETAATIRGYINERKGNGS